MYRVSWINSKKYNSSHIDELLKKSVSINQLTNYGPLVRKLELFFIQEFELTSDKTVIAVANGALALNALVAGINWFKGEKLHYATQAFTFPCSAQGELQGSLIVDIDEDYALDLEQVPSEIDGLVVTNLFGNVVDINKYCQWADQHNKILLFDNATVPFTKYCGKYAVSYGTGSIVSLHHTKPIGFGEGGLIIVDKKYEETIRKCVNFGFNVVDGIVTWHPYGTNCKMSEISAAYILSYIQLCKDKIFNHHIKIYKLFKEKVKEIEGIRLFPNHGSIPFVNCFAIICDQPPNLTDYELHNITAKKYYYPLKELPISTRLFKDILCLPCHVDVDEDTLDRYIHVLKNNLIVG